jgi:formylglycine-generating enzyme required for sulfatase activity
MDPVDWISPQAAMYVARLLGCRFPSSAEWQEAAKRAPNANPNLRDQTYLTQFNHVKNNIDRFEARNSMDWPAANVLRLQENTEAVPAEKEEEVVPGSDGVLYFNHVNEPTASEANGPVFYNLIGNVWEYTYEQPLEVEKLQSTAPEDIYKLIGNMYAQVRVIGGSALSNPDIAINEPKAPKRTEALRGWSDVGFRLAFSTGAGAGGSGTPKQRLMSLLQTTPYLSKPAGN